MNGSPARGGMEPMGGLPMRLAAVQGVASRSRTDGAAAPKTATPDTPHLGDVQAQLLGDSHRMTPANLELIAKLLVELVRLLNLLADLVHPAPPPIGL